MQELETRTERKPGSRILHMLWRILFGRKAPAIGFSLLVGIMVFIELGQLLSPYKAASNTGNIVLPLPPSLAHPFGTDAFGHDLVTQIAYGASSSLSIALGAATGAVLIGFFAGVFSGYYGKLEGAIGGATDVVLTTPALPMIILVGSLFIATNLFLTWIITIFLWAPVSRVVRTQVLAVKRLPYVEATKTSGTRDIGVVFKVIVPEVGALGIAYFIITVAISTIIVTAVEFIGVGNPIANNLGSVLYWAQMDAFLSSAWWWVVAPGLIITLFAVGFALIGFSVEEILNPRLKE